MPTTYQVLGPDNQAYGPVPIEMIQQWIVEGRLTADTQVMRSDMNQWEPASSLPELGFASEPVQTPLPAPAPEVQAPAGPIPVTAVPRGTAPAAGTLRTAPAGDAVLQALAQQINAGASWFYWIAALSLINTIASLSGSSWGFIVGLGATRVLDAVGETIEGGGKAVILVLTVVVLGVVALFGWLAGRRYLWAFVVGMVLYAIDGLLFLLSGEWLAVGFHVLALYFIFKGFQACRLYHRAAQGHA